MDQPMAGNKWTATDRWPGVCLIKPYSEPTHLAYTVAMRNSYFFRTLSIACLATLLIACASDSGVDNRGSGTEQWWDKLPRPEWSQFERLDAGDGWFEVYRITPRVIAIYEPGQFEEVISFLIIGDDRALLFDSGLGIGDIRGGVAGLTDHELVLLNSHTHYDHVGGNYQFDTIWGVDTPFSRARARGLDNDAVVDAVSEGWIWKPLPVDFDSNAYVSRPWTVDSFVSDGMQIDLGGISLEVVATPGHAPDCISLLDRHNRMLFTGDTFYLAALYTHIEGSNLADYTKTARRLETLTDKVDTLVTSHNVPTASADYLPELNRAMQGINAGTAPYDIVDGIREYRFSGFSVLTQDPPEPNTNQGL